LGLARRYAPLYAPVGLGRRHDVRFRYAFAVARAAERVFPHVSPRLEVVANERKFGRVDRKGRGDTVAGVLASVTSDKSSPRCGGPRGIALIAKLRAHLGGGSATA